MDIIGKMDFVRKLLPALAVVAALGILGFFIYRNALKPSVGSNGPSPSPSFDRTVPLATVQPEVNSGTNIPLFNPQTYKCSNFNYQLTVSPQKADFDPRKFIWQTSAPRLEGEMPKKNSSAQIGLRNKNGKASESFEYIVRVYQPDGNVNIGRGILKGDQWSLQNFPQDFQSAATTQTGTYTFTYEIFGVPIACDGFTVVP